MWRDVQDSLIYPIYCVDVCINLALVYLVLLCNLYIVFVSGSTVQARLSPSPSVILPPPPTPPRPKHKRPVPPSPLFLPRSLYLPLPLFPTCSLPASPTSKAKSQFH